MAIWKGRCRLGKRRGLGKDHSRPPWFVMSLVGSFRKLRLESGRGRWAMAGARAGVELPHLGAPPSHQPRATGS